MNVEYAVLGLSQGFLGLDLKNPLYCFTDGLLSLKGAFEMLNRIFNEEEEPMQSDIW